MNEDKQITTDEYIEIVRKYAALQDQYIKLMNEYKQLLISTLSEEVSNDLD